MKRKFSKLGRSTVSVLLCLVMLLTTFCFFDIGSVISEALISKSSHALTEAGTSSDTFAQYNISAPELVYIKAGGKDSEFFLNATSSGTVSEPTSATSVLSFSCATARSVTISITVLDANLNASSANRVTNVAFSDGTYMSSDRTLSASSSSINKTISSLTMANAEQGKEYIIRWNIVYTTASGSYTTYAYTGVKFPLLSQAGMTTRQYYYGTSGGLANNPAESSTYSFITGVDAVKGGNNGSRYTNTGSTLTAPLINFNASLYPRGLDMPVNSTYFDPDGTGVLLCYALRNSNGAYFAQASRVYNTQWDSSQKYNPMSMISDDNVSKGYFGGKPSSDGDAYGYAAADITIDTSRYTDFSQVPNLRAGFVEFDSDGGQDNNFLNAIRNSSYTTSDAADYFRNNRTITNSAGKQNTSPTIYADVDRENEKNDRSWVRGLYTLNGNITTAKNTLKQSTSGGTSLTIASLSNNVYTTYIAFEYSLRFDPWIGYKEYCSGISRVRLNATLADKSTARKYYYQFLNSGVNTSASNWSTINTYVQAYVKTLCVSSAAAGSYTDPTSAISTAQAALKDSMKTTTPLSAPVYFYVPEAIYLVPKVNSWISSTTSNFQYFIQNTVNTSDTSVAPTVRKGAKASFEKTGYVYFSYANISGNVTLTTRNIKASTITNSSPTTLSGGSISSLTLSTVGQYQRATITTSSTSPSIPAADTGYYIEWTASFKDAADGHTKSVTAYTYVYKPYVVPTAAGVQVRCTDVKDHDNGQLSWMSGFHDIYSNATTPTVGSSDQKAAYPRYTTVDKAYALMPFMSYDTGSISGDINFKISDMGTSGNQNVVSGTKPDYRKQSTAMKLAFASATNSSSYFKYTGYVNNWPHDWMSTTQNASTTLSNSTTVNKLTASFFYWKDDDDMTAQITTGGVGKIYIDTSRYSNLNQIPNLGVGMQMTDNEDTATSDNGAWMIADATGISSSTYTSHQGNGGKIREEWNNVNYYIAGMGTPDNRNKDYDKENLKYAGNWNRELLTGETQTYQIKTGQFNNQGDDWILCLVVLKLNATQVDKTDLRAAVRTAQMNFANFGIYNNSFSSRYYQNTGDYANFVSNYKTACAVLDKVDGYSGYTTQTSINNLKNALLANIAALVKEGNTVLKRSCPANEYNLGLEKLSNGQYKIVEIDGGQQYSMTYDARDNVYFTPDTYKGYTFAGKYELTNETIVPSNYYGKTLASLPTFFSASNLYSNTMSYSGSTATVGTTSTKTTTVPKFDGNNTTYEWVAAVNDTSLTIVNFYFVDQNVITFDVNYDSNKPNLMGAYSMASNGGFSAITSSTTNGVTITYNRTTGETTLNGEMSTVQDTAIFTSLLPDNFAAGDYSLKLTYLGGSVTGVGGDFSVTSPGEKNSYLAMCADLVKADGNNIDSRCGVETYGASVSSTKPITVSAAQASQAYAIKYHAIPCATGGTITKITFNSYKIKLEYVNSSNGTTGFVPNSLIQFYGHQLGTMPVPERENYRFLGWFTAPDGGDRVTASTVMGSSDMTVYAHWAVSEKVLLLDNEFNFDEFAVKATTAASTLDTFAKSRVTRTEGTLNGGSALNSDASYSYSVVKDDVGDTSLNIKYDRSTNNGSSNNAAFDIFKSSTFTASVKGDYTLTYEYRVNDYYSQAQNEQNNTDSDSIVLGFATATDYWGGYGLGQSYTANKKTSDGYEKVELKREFNAGDQFYFNMLFYFYRDNLIANHFRADLDLKNIVIKDPNGNIVLSSNSMATARGSSSFDLDARTITLKPTAADCYTDTYSASQLTMKLDPGNYTFMYDYQATTDTQLLPYIFTYTSETSNDYQAQSAPMNISAGSGTMAVRFTVTSSRPYIRVRFGATNYNGGSTISGPVTFGNISVQRTEIFSDGAYVSDPSTYLGWLTKTTSETGTRAYVNDLNSRNEVLKSHYQDIDYGAKYDEIHVPSREGFTFLGWYDASGTQYADATGKAVGDHVCTTDGLKLYSRWTPKTFNLQYNAFRPNDSAGAVTSGTVGNLPSPNPQTLKFGVASSISSTVPTLTGYTFSGWSKTSGGTKAYDKGQALSASTVSQMYKDCGGGTYNIYTVWTPHKFYVKFNGNGSTTGTMANQQFTYDVYQNLTKNAFVNTRTLTYNKNDTTASPATIDRTSDTKNLTFKGWTATAEGVATSTPTVRYTDGQNIKNPNGYSTDGGTTNLYAKWQGVTVTLPTPTRAGYVFAGWYDAATGGNKIGDAGASYTITADKTIYAHWTANKITVKFNGNGSTSGSTADQEFTYDVAQALRANGFSRAYTVTYSGNFSGKTPTLGATSQTATYTFKNWNNAANGSGSYTYTYTNGQTVTNPNGATSGTTYLYAQWNSASVTLPTATLPGYTFLGWYDAATGGNKIGDAGATYTPTANKTLYAHWNANTITVKFNGNGSTGGTTADQTFTYDVAQALRSNGFTRAYTVTYNGNFTGKTPTLGATSQTATYTLKNWNNAAAGNGSYTYTNGQTVTNPNGATSGTTYLYAQWTSASVTLPTATLPGYTFLGWYDAATGGNKIGGAGASYTPTAAKTLYAHWSANAITVKFSGNGSTSGSMTDQVFTYDTAQALKSNGFTRAYTVTYNGNFSGKTPTLGATSQTATYTFKNWNNAANGSGSYTYTNGQTVTNPNGVTSGTTYLYAQWTPSSVKLPTATLPGYTFLGWYDAATGGNRIGGAGDSYTPTAAKTLYAHWQANTITVKFNGNGSTSGSTADQTFTYDVAQALRSNGFTRAYTVTYNGNFAGKTPTLGATSQTATYTFKNWNNAANGSGSYTYTNGQTVTNPNGATSGTTNLYAQWNSASVKLPTASLPGYTFLGWYDAATGGNKIGDAGATYTPTAAKTLYAHWNANTNTAYKVNVYVMNTVGAYPTTPTTYSYTGTTDTSVTVSPATYYPDKSGEFSLDSSKSNVLTGTINGDGSLVLVVYIKRASHTVTYDSATNGGSTATQTRTVYYQGTVDLTLTATKNGWTFIGWNTDKNATTKLDSLTMGTSNITLYAIFSKTVLVHFYSGSKGAVHNQFSVTFKNSETTGTVTAPTSFGTVSGWTALGWTASTAASKTVGDAAIKGGATITVTPAKDEYVYYAIYTQSQTLKYEANANGDTSVKNIPANGTLAGAYYNSADTTLNVTRTIPSTAPTRNGYTFKSWNTQANGSGTNYAAGASYTNSAQTDTLYAQWNENSYTITYVNGNGNADTKVGYKITAEITIIAAPTYDGYVFVGWKVTTVTNGNWTSGDLYGAGAKVGSGKYGDVTLVAQWVYVKDAETKSGEYNQDNAISIVTGVDANGNTTSITTTKYDTASFKKYTDAINAYNNAKNAIPTDVNASDYSTRLAAATKTLQDAINALVDITLNERGVVTDYLNNFLIDASGTRHNLNEMNLNHYDLATTVETAKNALVNGNAIKAKNYSITAKDTDGKSFQTKLNEYVAAMAKAFKTKTQVKTEGPGFKVYENADAAKAVTDANGKTLAGATAVNYVYAGKGNYTYYCYTNSTNPTVLITVDDIENAGRVCYPTTAKATAEPTVSGSATSASTYSIAKIPASNADNDYLTYTKLSIGGASSYYQQKQVITLTPEFTSGANGKVTYEFTATDDSLTPNVATQSALSSGIGNANTFSANLTDDAANTKKITIVVDYHPGDTFDVTGDQVEADKYLNQYHLFRASGGASNWELPATGDKVYKVNDTTYGQTDRGSFTFTYELGATDIGNGKINTTDVNEIVKLFKTEANYNAAKSMTFVGAKYWTKASNGTKVQHEGPGLGYQSWGTNWSFNYYPKSESYTYVHLVDRWGNAVDKVFYVGKQDIKDVTVSTASADGAYTILEDGGSGIATLSLNAGTMEILTDSNSTLENNVYRTTGNTIRIKTGEANKSYTLTMKDKATNASTATLKSDENGIITLSVEDTAYKSGVYTFMLNDTEINLYDGVSSDKYIVNVYDGEAEDGEFAEMIVITTGEVGKIKFTDTDGNTITVAASETNEDGTKTWRMSKSRPAGEYEYRISVKVGYNWIEESSTGKLIFTEKVLDTGRLVKAEYDEESGLYKLTIEGRATKVQFITEDGMTRTYTRYSDSVKSRKSYDAEGNEVPDTGRLLDHEVWLVNARLYSGQNYTVAAKFEAGWNREGTASLTAH